MAQGNGLNRTLDNLGKIGRFIADPLGVTKKGGAVDVAIDRVQGAIERGGKQVMQIAGDTTAQVEDLLDPNESSAMATTSILWIVGLAGLGIVVYLIFRAWR